MPPNSRRNSVLGDRQVRSDKRACVFGPDILSRILVQLRCRLDSNKMKPIRRGWFLHFYLSPQFIHPLINLANSTLRPAAEWVDNRSHKNQQRDSPRLFVHCLCGPIPPPVGYRNWTVMRSLVSKKARRRFPSLLCQPADVALEGSKSSKLRMAQCWWTSGWRWINMKMAVSTEGASSLL
jgi:hypothetical protein